MKDDTFNPSILFVDDIKSIKIENHINTTIVYIDMSIQSVLEPQERVFTFVFSPEQIDAITKTMKYYRKKTT